MTDSAGALRLERALTVGGIGRASTGELSPVTRAIYANEAGKGFAWKRRVLNSASNTFTPEQLAQYALWLTENGYARSTAQLAVRAIRWRHRVAGEPVPDGVPARVVLRAGDSTGVDHDGVNGDDTPARRDPSELLSAFVAQCRPGESKGMRDLAIVNLLYWSGSTIDELPPLAHIDLSLGGRPARLRHLPDPGHYATLCPVCTAGQWALVLVGEGADGIDPLLRSIDKGGNIAGVHMHGGKHMPDGGLLAKNVNRVVLRSLAARAGLLDVLRSPAQALRLAGACAAYVRGDVDADGAARHAGYRPGSHLFVMRLLELTAPTREEPLA